MARRSKYISTIDNSVEEVKKCESPGSRTILEGICLSNLERKKGPHPTVSKVGTFTSSHGADHEKKAT